jgi:hypothetical protein
MCLAFGLACGDSDLKMPGYITALWDWKRSPGNRSPRCGCWELFSLRPCRGSLCMVREHCIPPGLWWPLPPPFRCSFRRLAAERWGGGIVVLRNLDRNAVEALDAPRTVPMSKPDVQNGHGVLTDRVEGDNFVEAAVSPNFCVFKLLETQPRGRAQP